jgi:hypothetical protein
MVKPNMKPSLCCSGSSTTPLGPPHCRAPWQNCSFFFFFLTETILISLHRCIIKNSRKKVNEKTTIFQGKNTVQTTIVFLHHTTPSQPPPREWLSQISWNAWLQPFVTSYYWDMGLWSLGSWGWKAILREKRENVKNGGHLLFWGQNMRAKI